MHIRQLLLLSAAVAGLFGLPAAQAAEAASSKMLIYIQPQEYNNSVRLSQYSRSYWYEQGPLVESAATKVLGNEFGEVAVCDSNQLPTNALVWLRPRMFFNPQMQVFHGKVTAVAYTATGKPIATYVGESSKSGFLDISPEKKITEVYQQAMQIVADKMKADGNLQTLLASNATATENKTPCGLVSLLPEPKVQFMSF